MLYRGMNWRSAS
ncbi:UNVERIFIED_CONTAM: hypothetical protein GTU68_042838 [Idotea baltica]|nr:hypothetical protein [Idotea baltica]